MQTNNLKQEDKDVPLVLDIDGTLLRTDLLYETFWAALGHDFASTVRVALSNFRDPECLKHDLTAIARPQIELLPVRQDIVEMARSAVAAGRAVHLVSASHQNLVDELADHLGLPGPHFGSQPNCILTDATKASFLEEQFGKGAYDFAGNARAGLNSWKGPRKIIAVGPSPAVQLQVAETQRAIRILPDGWDLRNVIRELRPHQWVKNLLLFLPVLAAQSFTTAGFIAVTISALSFSLGASSIYILNDLLDLEADRSHPEKRFRPIASGALPIGTAMKVSALLAIAAILLALSVSLQIAGLTVLYMAGSFAYSLWLKKRRWLDLLTLACLFMLRLLAGAFAAKVSIPLLLSASGFAAFFVLACVKRLTALSRMPSRDHLPGRSYSRRDLLLLERAAYTSIPATAFFFLAYTWGPHASSLYTAPLIASLAVIPFVLWLFRMVRLSVSGREDYDPVRFVLHDRISLALATVGIVLIVLAARGF